MTKSSVSLWLVNSESPNAPLVRGVVQLTREDLETLVATLDDDSEQVELSIALWRNDKEGERAPVYKGLVEPRSEERQQKATTKKSEPAKKKGSRIL